MCPYNFLGFVQEKDPSEILTLLLIVLARSGIEKIYEGKTDVHAINQVYFKDMMNEAGKTRSLKLLFISGYEDVGKGSTNSIFFDFIRSATIPIEIIMIEPNNSEVIGERVEQLKKCNPSCTVEAYSKAVSETFDQLRTLKKNRIDDSLNVYHCKFHSIFKLAIFDDCVFMSTYEVDLHGYEAPTYKIDRVSDPNADRTSLYDTFSDLFGKIKKSSESASLD